MSELRELTGRELDAVGGGGFLNNFGTNWFQAKDQSVVGMQLGQQLSILSLNGINTFNFH
jgi:hypothetical protein